MLKKLLEVLRFGRKRVKERNKGTILHLSMGPGHWLGKRVRIEDIEVQSVRIYDTQDK